VKKGFVQTENYKRLLEAKALVDKRGAREAGLVIIKGIYGVGKSELTERWATDSNWVFVRAKETWTKRALLDELADKMGVGKSGRNQEVQARIIGKIAVDMIPIIVDEADFLVRSTASLLEVLRDITDVTGTTCFLVGMEHFPSKVSKYGHIASRVASVVEFKPLSLADVASTIKQKSEVAMDEAVVAEVAQQANGRMRLVLNAIATIEGWAAANGWASVNHAHIAGKKLCAQASLNGVRLGAGAKD
jgi:DNA transposition AAA+ family ATPase